jgi:hypothetical protein
MKKQVPLALLLLSSLAGIARANPRPLAFTYPSESLPAGATEFEQFVDLTPVRGLGEAGELSWVPRSILTTELEFGLTDRLELALYLQVEDDPGAATGPAGLRFEGVKQRLRWRLADVGAWPVDVALYGEVAEMRDELELEAKIILQRRFDRLRLMANLWGEREFAYSGAEGAWVVNPTAGVTYEITPSWHVGVEGWMRAELGEEEEESNDPTAKYNRGPLVYVGPDLMWQRGRVWLTAAPYLRVDPGNRVATRGDLYGRVYVRMIVGIEF